MKSSFSGHINSVKTLTITEGRKVKDTQAVMKFNRLTFPFYIHFNPLKLKPFQKAMCSRVQRDNNQGLVQRDKKNKKQKKTTYGTHLIIWMTLHSTLEFHLKPERLGAYYHICLSPSRPRSLSCKDAVHPSSLGQRTPGLSGIPRLICLSP